MSASGERGVSESMALGVSHVKADDPESISAVRGADTRSWKIERPDGVAFVFQVGPNFIEAESNVSLNILEKDDSRSAFLDEPEDVRPEVARIVGSPLFASD